MIKFPEIFGLILIAVGLTISIVGGYAVYTGSHIEIQRNCVGEVCTPQNVQIYPYWVIVFPAIGGILIALTGLSFLYIMIDIETEKIVRGLRKNA